MERFRRVPVQRLDKALVVLALPAVLAPGFAAVDAMLPLASGAFFWGGMAGLGLGVMVAHHAAPSASRRTLRVAVSVLIWFIGLALLLCSIGQALPSLDVAAADISVAISWAWKGVWRDPGAGEVPQMLTPALWRVALTRFRDQLITAPAGGERGAALMLSVAGATLTWSGAFLTGIAIRARRTTLTYGLPLLVALGIVAIPGGSGGSPLAIGFGVWLVLAIASDFRRREALWDVAAIDYSTELFRDMVIWGGLLTAGALFVAWALPLWSGNPLARIFIRDEDIPSGLAVLERSIRRPLPSGGVADIGVPVFAELPLGLSLEQGPPEQPALRVTLSAPLPPAREPRYWRARIFNRYTGDGWGSSARVADEPSVAFPNELLPGTIMQHVEDLRPRRSVLIALPDPLFADLPTRAERLRDGSLMALVPVGSGGAAALRTHYRVLSRLPEQMPPLEARQPGGESVDLGPYLALPTSLPMRVRDLAVVIAGDMQGDEARALALERYLRNLPYAYKVEPLADGVDGVDHFLFSMRSGYCTYYASAMAVMARALGIPSRIAVGYALGEYDEGAGVYLVREADAHAWTELFINGRWVAFEPTPVRPLPDRGARAPASAPVAIPTEVAPPDRTSSLLIWFTILVGVAATVGVFLIGRRLPRETPIVCAQRDLERCGARVGVAWSSGTTIHEYATLVALRAPEITADLMTLATLLNEACYSNHCLDSATAARMEQTRTRLRSWRPARRPITAP
ncbi:MAG: transglutaminase TgpA family protein [Roseiflexus sp.]